MRRVTILACLLVASAVMVRRCEAHGFSINLSGSQITATPMPFYSTITDLGFTNPEVFLIDHGYFGKVAGSAFGASDTFRWDAVGPLWFSDGTAAATAAGAGVSLEAQLKPGPTPTTTITGSSSGVTPGFSAGTTPDSHSVNWFLRGNTVTDGAYGFRMRISGYQGGNLSAPYTPVDVLLVFGTLSDANFPLRTTAVANIQAAAFAAVAAETAPEPGTLTLLVAGIAASVYAKRRRRTA